MNERLKGFVVAASIILVLSLISAALLGTAKQTPTPTPDAPKSNIPTEKVILPSAKLKAGASGMECPNCYFPVPGRVARNGKPFTVWNFCPRCGCKFVKE